MSAFHDSALIGASGQGEYQIERSLRFNPADSAYLSRNLTSAGNRKTWTWAGWVKRSNIGIYSSPFGTYFGNQFRYFILRFLDNDTIQVYGGNYTTGSSTSVNINYITSSVYRDVGAWYHIVFSYDTTQATEANRARLYVNGQQVTAFSTSIAPALNSETFVNAQNAIHYLGEWGFNIQYFDGYLADIHFIDGQALDPTSFGFFDGNGIWQPKAYTGSYGTNGFHLPFNDNSTAAALGTDVSGNGNTWTVNNISVAAGSGNDSLVDVPTNGTETDTGVGGGVRGNYCTLNPLDKPNNTGGALANGNLDLAGTSNAYSMYRGSIQIPGTGKWYYECTFNGTAASPRGFSSQYSAIGVSKANVAIASIIDSNTLWMGDSGYGCNFSSSRVDFAGQVIQSGAIVGVAINRDANTFEFFLNGVSVETGTIGVAGGSALAPYAFCYNNTKTTLALNFGQRPFAYPAPSGFKALNTANLPTPTIADGSTAMDVVTYTGNGTSQTISGLEFSPDLIWFKSRSASRSHSLFDSVRGRSKSLFSDLTIAELTSTSTEDLVSFDANGFTVGTVSQSGSTNTNNDSIVAWTWDAGSSTVTNNDGTITSQVRANPSAGFSVATLTTPASGTFTVGHGLNTAPHFVICKARNQAFTWITYHRSIGAGNYLLLNSTQASIASATIWQNTDPSSTLIYGDTANWGTADYVMYSFAPVDGYSSFGSYTGNGSTDGPFVYTGHRTRFLLYKRSDVANDWYIMDTARDPYNVTTQRLLPNSSASEYTYTTTDLIDVTANGFKIRGSNNAINANNGTYIYCAFAENPFSLARAR